MRDPGGADPQSPRVTHRFQVASSRPAATSLSKRTSGSRSRRRVRGEPLDDLARRPSTGSRGRPRCMRGVRVEQRPGAKTLDEPPQLGGASGRCAVDEEIASALLKNRCAARVLLSPSRPNTWTKGALAVTTESLPWKRRRRRPDQSSDGAELDSWCSGAVQRNGPGYRIAARPSRRYGRHLPTSVEVAIDGRVLTGLPRIIRRLERAGSSRKRCRGVISRSARGPPGTIGSQEVPRDGLVHGPSRRSPRFPRARRAALAERGVNITGIVGVAEDTDGALMLTTCDPDATREAFNALGLAFEEHDPTGGAEPGLMSVGDLRPGAAGRGSWADAAPTTSPPPPSPSASSSSTSRGDPGGRRARSRTPAGGFAPRQARRRRDGDRPGAEIELEVEGCREDGLAARARGSTSRRSSRHAALDGLRQAGDRRRRRRAGRPGRARRGERGGPAQPAGRADLRRHDPARRRGGNRRGGAGRRGPAPRPAAGPRRLDHGRRHQRGRRGAARGRHPDHRAQHGRLDHRPRGPRRVRPVQAGTMAVMAVAETATFDLARQRGRRYCGTDAHRDLERQLAQGPDGGGRVVAGARPSRRPAPPGDQARRPGRARHARSRWPATTSSITGRAAGTASRSPTRKGWASSDIVTNFGLGPVRDSAPGRRAASARTTSTRSMRRGC